MKNYWLIHLGEKNKYADVAKNEGFIAVGWAELNLDLTNCSLNQKEFSKLLARPLEVVYPNRSKQSRASVTGRLYSFRVLMKPGDIVLMPNESTDIISVGEVTGDYEYVDQHPVPYTHRRKVKWLKELNRPDFSEGLKNSAGSIMTLFSLSSHASEIERLLSNDEPTFAAQSIDYESIEDFGLESHLEDFLVHNWSKTELGKDYEIYQEDGTAVGQQYITEIGRIDILAKSKDGKEWLVIELKKGRSGDAVVGQVLRYIGYVQQNMAENDEIVKGLVITGEDDSKIRYAISVLPNVEFKTYSVSFKLHDAALTPQN